MLDLQKKRKYGRDQAEEREAMDKQAEEDEALKDATTLYVGNLWVWRITLRWLRG